MIVQAGREELEPKRASRPIVLGGVAGWLLGQTRSWLHNRLRRAPRPRPRLALLERIALAPRQSLALVEAEGRHLLVVTSAEGGSAFYPLDDPRPLARRAGEAATPAGRATRVSW